MEDLTSLVHYIICRELLRDTLASYLSINNYLYRHDQTDKYR